MGYLPTDDTVDVDQVRPRDPVELWLAQRWRELLGFPVGIRDNFFGMGGNSLDAARMANSVLATFDVQLPVNVLVENPTVERLAALLRNRNANLADPLVEIQYGEGNHRPLFLVHPANGQVGPYYDLARALGEEFAVFGLQAVGLYSDADPLNTVLDMAHRYVDMVRSVQPSGPYCLGGCSTGSLVAMEMARRFATAGDRVCLLADIDLAVLEPSFAEWEPRGGAHGAEVTARVVDGWRATELVPADETGCFADRTVRVWRANRAAARAYSPGPYDGAVDVFCSPRGQALEADWTAVATLQVHTIDVDEAGTAGRQVAGLLREKIVLSGMSPD